MGSHVAAVATLALAILFSPETLVLGLVIAGDAVAPRLAAIAYAVGGVIGIAFSTGIGLWIAYAAGANAIGGAHRTSWPGFVVRILLAGALLAIGLYRGFSAFRRTPIRDVSESDQKPSRLVSLITNRFPNVMRKFGPDAVLTSRQRAARGGLAGFAACGLHPKIFPIAIAAGHQITEIANPAQRTLAIALFAAIAVIPAVLPALIEVVQPGAVGRVKSGYEQIMKVHGRWITAVLLLGASVFVGLNAVERLPARL